MSFDYLSEEGIVEALRQRCWESTQKQVAQELGFSPQYISDILRGRREMSSALAEKMGYTRMLQYRRQPADAVLIYVENQP